MSARNNEWAEEDARETNTSAFPAWTTHLTLTHTPGDNTRWFYFASCVMDRNSTTTDWIVDIFDGTTEFGGINFENNDTTDNISVEWMFEVSYGVAPGSKSYDLRASGEGGGTTGIAYKKIFGLQCSANDHFDENTAETTTTSSTFQTAFTFSESLAAGTYLFIASGEMGLHTSGGDAIEVRAVRSGTNYGTTRYSPPDNGSYYTWMTGFVVAVAGGTETVTLEFRSTDNAATARFRKRRVAAIKLDNFANYYYAETRARDTETGASPADQNTLNLTPAAARNHIAFGFMIGDSETLGVNSHFRFHRDGSVIQDMDREPDAVNDCHPIMSMKRESLAVASTTYEQEKWQEPSGTTGASEACIVVIDLEEAPPPPTGCLGVPSRSRRSSVPNLLR